jgi:hypothetical protein
VPETDGNPVTTKRAVNHRALWPLGRSGAARSGRKISSARPKSTIKQHPSMNTNQTGNHHLQFLQQQISAAEPRAGIAMLVFWKNLFELNPSLRPLLGEKPGEEDYFLVQFLAAGLGPLFRQTQNTTSADKETTCAPVNSDEEQCSVVGEAQLWSLEEAFGADFTPRVRSAWEMLYRFITVSNKQSYVASEQEDFDAAIAAA